jgi:hypothetical protein
MVIATTPDAEEHKADKFHAQTKQSNRMWTRWQHYTIAEDAEHSTTEKIATITNHIKPPIP